MARKRKQKPSRKTQEQDRAKNFGRRAFVVGAIQGGLLIGLGARLGYLQLVQGQQYTTLSERNRINTKILAPSRGQIVDRYGVPLALNNQNFRLLIVPEQVDDLKQQLVLLKNYIELSDRQIETVLKEAKSRAKFVPIEIRDNLQWRDVARIEVNLPALPGVSVEEGEIRSYPFSEATAHLIGYVGAVTEADLSPDSPVLSLPGFKIGKTGIEKAYDLSVRGEAGTAQMEVNVIGRQIRELKRQDSKQGDRLVLGIDAELQRMTQDRLNQERSASAVIMDAHNGAIYAAASSPSFDPNNFTRGISLETWETLLSDDGHPLTNKAIAGQYPPASTFKMVTVLAGLERGVITPNSLVYCPGHYDLGKERFHCWKRGGHGWMDLFQALSQSCDTFFYDLCDEIGIDNIADMARRLGLGERLDFEISEERPGLMPTQDWKRGRFGTKWQKGETLVASIGQGYILATPLQLAVMTARLVNGGYAVRPWLTAIQGDQVIRPPKPEKLNLNEDHLALVKKGMDMAVNDRKGTAFGSRIETPLMEMGGKTGTAQVKRITMNQRIAGIRNEDLMWKHRHHALFVGYAPVHAPRYICSIVVEHGGGGSSAAAPIGKELLKAVQLRDPASKSIEGLDLALAEPKRPTVRPSQKPEQGRGG